MNNIRKQIRKILTEEFQTYASEQMNNVMNAGKINLLYNNGLRKQFYFNKQKLSISQRIELEKEIKEELQTIFKNFINIDTSKDEVNVYIEGKRDLIKISVKLDRITIPYIQYNFINPKIKVKIGHNATVKSISDTIIRDKSLFEKHGLDYIFN